MKYQDKQISPPTEILGRALRASDGLKSVNLKRIKRFYHSQGDAFSRRDSFGRKKHTKRN
jgi:hypothetical protein